MKVKPWPLAGQKIVSENRIFSLVERRFTSPETQKTGNFYVLESADWVNVLAITPDKEVILVKQFRFGSQEISWEFPGGVVDNQEDPKEAALRELKEETGYIANKITSLGCIRPNPAILNNNCHAFLAEDLQSTGSLNLDDTEEVETLLVPLEKLPKMVAKGQLNHAIALSVLALYQNIAL